MRLARNSIAVLFTLQCFVACAEDNPVTDDDDGGSTTSTSVGQGGMSTTGVTSTSVGQGGMTSSTSVTSSSVASTTGQGGMTSSTSVGQGGMGQGGMGQGGMTSSTSVGQGGMGGMSTTTGVGGMGAGGGMTTTGTCAMPIALGNAPNVTVTGDTTGAPDALAPSCAATSGPELVYEWTAPTTGDYAFLLTTPPPGQMGPAADLGISLRTTCLQAASELQCSDAIVEGVEGFVESVTQNTTYSILIDGYGNTDAGPFELEIQQVVDETNCTDLTDNDFDGLIDCNDPTNCQTLAVCTPGAGATGTACTMPNQCAATPNDPLCLPASSGWANGYCTEFCNLLNDDCATGALCADFNLGNDTGLCLDACATSNDCQNPNDYFCTNIGGNTDVCLPNSCGTATALVLGANAGDNSTGVATHQGSCQLGSAPEAVYTFTAPSNGTLTLSLTSAADLGIHVRTTCNDVNTEVGCADANIGGQMENLTVTTTMGTTYYIFVDGYDAGEVSAFTLNASFI